MLTLGSEHAQTLVTHVGWWYGAIFALPMHQSGLMRGAFLPQKSELGPLGQPGIAQKGGYGLKTLPITISAWAPLKTSNIWTPFGVILASKLVQCHQQWDYGGCFRVMGSVLFSPSGYF